MARKKEPEKAANHERWLVSYADFITLLFAVFVTLYAMSQTDKQKVEMVAASYRSAFGITYGASSGKPNFIPKTDIMPIPAPKTRLINPEKAKSKMGEKEKEQEKEKEKEKEAKVQATKKEFKEILLSIEKFLIDNKAQDKVDLELTRRGLVISLKEAGFFDSGSATVKPAAQAILNKIGEALQPYNNQISFEGHTDNIPIRSLSFRSNWELSTSRATNLAHFFMDRQNFTPEKLSVTGYGEYRPVADNSTDEGRKRNRRVDLVLLGATVGEIEEAPPAKSPPPQPQAQPQPQAR